MPLSDGRALNPCAGGKGPGHIQALAGVEYLQQEAPMGSPELKESRVVSARVIKWDEDNFGVAVDYADHQHSAYVVGTREQALAEAVEIRTGMGIKRALRGS
jgi:hypothetical protein